MEVEWPGRRADVLNALDLLSREPATLVPGELDNAVHWLVDDTWWDQNDPRESVGTILRDEREAEAIRHVVAAIDGVADRQFDSDAAWFSDPDWSTVRGGASTAAALLRRGDLAGA